MEGESCSPQTSETICDPLVVETESPNPFREKLREDKKEEESSNPHGIGGNPHPSYHNPGPSHGKPSNPTKPNPGTPEHCPETLEHNPHNLGGRSPGYSLQGGTSSVGRQNPHPQHNPVNPEDQNPGNPSGHNPGNPGSPKSHNPGNPKDHNPGNPKDHNPESPKGGNPGNPQHYSPRDSKDHNPGNPKDHNPGSPKGHNPGNPKDHSPKASGAHNPGPEEKEAQTTSNPHSHQGSRSNPHTPDKSSSPHRAKSPDPIDKPNPFRDPVEKPNPFKEGASSVTYTDVKPTQKVITSPIKSPVTPPKPKNYPDIPSKRHPLSPKSPSGEASSEDDEEVARAKALLEARSEVLKCNRVKGRDTSRFHANPFFQQQQQQQQQKPASPEVKTKTLTQLLSSQKVVSKASSAQKVVSPPPPVSSSPPSFSPKSPLSPEPASMEGPEPSKLAFKDKWKRFEQQIDEQSHSTPKTSTKKVSLVSDQDLQKIKEDEQKKISTMTPDDLVNYSQSGLDENNSFSASISISPIGAKKDGSNHAELSASELRSREADEKEKLRAARIKALEDDALQAERVLHKTQEINKLKSPESQESKPKENGENKSGLSISSGGLNNLDEIQFMDEGDED